MELMEMSYFSGIVSSVLSKNGEGFYANSASEFARFTLSARLITQPECDVELKEGMRPPPPEPEPEPVVEEQTAEEQPAAAAETTEGATETAEPTAEG